ncbi:MAG: radical SAM protein [Candidatus Eisenbacteria bacterium]|nr:radical SAM protein [Candidatus Eisenbacteria bacterium]
MIGVTRLLCGIDAPSDTLRYGRKSADSPLSPTQFSADRRPIVIWNMTNRCNLHCIHCYSESKDRVYAGELTTDEGEKFINDLAEFRVPVLLFSGGEPLLRKDIFRLGSHAVEKGIRVVISTNGTLITGNVAAAIRKTGFSYVGVSLDGMRSTNDKFRGKKGGFDEALEGIRNLKNEGVKVGLRFTLNKHNLKDLGGILELLEKESIPRACFYHLVYAGRGSKLVEDDLTHDETRKAVNLIFDKAIEFCDKKLEIELLTVDNHTDGVYLLKRVCSESPERAEEVYELLLWNGGNSSGIAVADVDYLGNVHPDQFWTHYSLGNVRKRTFGDIWTDTSDPLLRGLKDRKHLLKGKCGSCAFLDICNGNFRVRAEAVFGDVWAEDPACYLTEEELRTNPLALRRERRS